MSQSRDGQTTDAPAASMLGDEKYLYAEDLLTTAGQHRKAVRKISRVVKAVIGHGRNAKDGWEIHFEGEKKVFGAGGVTVKRQLMWATGERDPAKMVGKTIVLYVVKSSSPLAATGFALRVAPAEGGGK